MIPQPQYFVHIVFRNGIKLEGEILSWNDNEAILKSIGSISTIVIQNPKDDILFYRLSPPKSEFEKIKAIPNKTPEDLRTLAELKNELNIVERAEIAEKLTSHEISTPPTNHYGSILNVKPIAQQYSRQETKTEDTGFGTELQNLFGQSKDE